MQCLHSLVVGLLVVVVALGLGQVALLALVLALEVGLVKLCDYLSLLYHAVVVHIKFLDDTGNLGTDLHLYDRLDSSCSGYVIGDPASLNLGHLEAYLGAFFPGSEVLPEGYQGNYHG